MIILYLGKLDSKRSVVKLLKRDGLVLEANPLKEMELKNHFQNEVGRLGLRMDQGFSTTMVKSNFDFAEVSKNLVFLQSYRGENEISLADIDVASEKLFKIISLI